MIGPHWSGLRRFAKFCVPQWDTEACLLVPKRTLEKWRVPGDLRSLANRVKDGPVNTSVGGRRPWGKIPPSLPIPSCTSAPLSASQELGSSLAKGGWSQVHWEFLTMQRNGSLKSKQVIFLYINVWTMKGTHCLQLIFQDGISHRKAGLSWPLKCFPNWFWGSRIQMVRCYPTYALSAEPNRGKGSLLVGPCPHSLGSEWSHMMTSVNAMFGHQKKIFFQYDINCTFTISWLRKHTRKG